MPFQGFTDLCLTLQIGEGEHCITMPGGSQLCVNFPGISPPTIAELMQQMFAQLNTALTPLQPIFNIIDTVVAMFECVKAISTLDPTEIINCIPNLAEKVNKLLTLIPQVAIPKMIVDIIDCIILFLQGIQQQLASTQEFLNRVLQAELAVVQPGNVGIQLAIDCARDQVSAQLDYMNENAKPVNRLIGLINFFLQVIGLKDQCIPSIGNVSIDLIDPFLNLIETLIEFLQLLRGFIPIPTVPQINSVECT